MTSFIVATDGSDLAIQAALTGLSLAKSVDTLLLVSVVELIDPAGDATGHAGPTLTEREVEASHRAAHAQGDAALAATAEALEDAGFLPGQVERLLVEGEPGRALCRVAAEVGASALIVGSRGRGGLKRALLGSVSDYVVDTRHVRSSSPDTASRDPPAR